MNENEKINTTTTESEDEFQKLLEEFVASACQNSERDPEDDPDPEPEEEEETVPEEEPEITLDDLTGLDSVKAKLHAFEKLMLFNQMRIERDLPTLRMPLHSMFLGSPGTGKTTVAKRLGKMLHRIGVLDSGHVVVRERATLSGIYYGKEEELTLQAIEEAEDGILFIDEAYQLYNPDDPRDPGRHVVNTLLTALADEKKRNWMLILAGYPDEMMRMFEMNPGLKSRIPDTNIYTFEDFSEEQLMEIATRYFAANQFRLTTKAKAVLTARLAADYAARDKNFGNARHVVNLIQTEIIPAMAQRVMGGRKYDVRGLSEILPCDIPVSQMRPCAPRRLIGYRA